MTETKTGRYIPSADGYEWPMDLDTSVGNNGIASAVYKANGLAYHNQTHIKQMLSLVPDQIKKEDRISELVAAIFWHDVVYEPGASDNEEESVNLFKIHNKKLMPETVELVSSLIMATKNHALSLTETPKLSTHLMFHEVIVDLDLYNLGGSWKEYLAIGQRIRSEFRAFADEEFFEGRKKFLEKYLAKPSVYLSGFFVERELAAQMNMQKELYLINRMGKIDYEN